ncbi:MAG: dihydrolipoyl dehydrogenase [Dehalococcoidia bacterium]|nr:dihydrolipoyl dehydrogenase [Dehalococcoidia bacterium]
MKDYDLVVIGSGCGAIVSDEAVGHGFKVALIDKGPLGGTCLNLGCIPSKMLIYAADRALDIQEARKLGIEAEIKSIDFAGIMARMRKSIKKSRDHIREGIKESKGLDFYEGEGHFVSDYTLEVNGQQVRGKTIVIACGSRPFIPPIKGVDTVDYWTNQEVLSQKSRPDSLIIIGGGYIAVEYGHFFAAMGTRVTILEMADRLTLAEEPEISALLKAALSRRMAVHTGAQAEEVRKAGNGKVTVAVKTGDGRRKEFTADRLLIAVGRKSNADLLKPENTGVQVDQRGFIKVNEYMETTKKGIYAVGDVNGLQMFTHAANRQASMVAEAILHGDRTKLDTSVTPHAVYSHPQIASVGLTEDKAKTNHQILVGRASYASIAKGEAMMEEEGFAKAILDKETNKILGFHIIGPFAPELIQEVTNAMAAGGDVGHILGGMHIHPALNELIEEALGNLQEV